MRYLAININDDLDQEWYCRLETILECYSYFDRLGPGHGPRTAIYDMERQQFIWIDKQHQLAIERLKNIVEGAVRKIHAHR